MDSLVHSLKPELFLSSCPPHRHCQAHLKENLALFLVKLLWCEFLPKHQTVTQHSCILITKHLPHLSFSPILVIISRNNRVVMLRGRHYMMFS